MEKSDDIVKCVMEVRIAHTKNLQLTARRVAEVRYAEQKGVTPSRIRNIKDIALYAVFIITLTSLWFVTIKRKKDMSLIVSKNVFQI